jgi:uncharacterized protein YyaL (SSP411 family)
MLYDNALLLRLYVDVFRVTREERYAVTAREIVSYTLREMTDADGGFYATQDADSEGEEGRFFVWSPTQIAELLSGDEEAAKVAAVFFGVTKEGNFEESGMTVLREAKSIAAVAIQLGLAPSVAERALTRAKAALFLAREKRIKPFRDEKILASWNGLMIGALAEAGGALADRAMIAAAERAFAFVESRLVIDDADGDRARVLRHAKGAIVKGPGFLDDHAFVADAALDLYEVTGDPRYVRRARAIADAMVRHFADTAGGGFYFAPDDGEALIHRAKDPYDHAIPSGTSIACKVLLRLGALTDAKHVELATKELERLAPMAVENPFGASQTVCVLDRLVRGSVDIVIVGARDDARTRALADVVLAAYVPNRTLAWADPANPDALDACNVVAEGKALAAAGRDSPIAYVCRGRTCSLPIADAGALAREIARGA